MLEKEASGLSSLGQYFRFKVPQTVEQGIIANKQFLVLEWLDAVPASEDSWRSLGKGLANLHRVAVDNFGWQEANYIGSLIQENAWCGGWSEFYASRRVLPLAKKLFDSADFTRAELQLADKFCNRLESLFPKEQAALLHGDLWSGNVLFTKSYTDIIPALIDPAIYYGHREIDIAMTLLFGGFAPAFYDAYNETFPLEPGWQNRMEIAQLYPLLVHAILFGGGYVLRARRIMEQYA